MSKFRPSSQRRLRALQLFSDEGLGSNEQYESINDKPRPGKWMSLGMHFTNEGMRGTEWLWCCGPEGHF